MRYADGIFRFCDPCLDNYVLHGNSEEELSLAANLSIDGSNNVRLTTLKAVSWIIENVSFAVQERLSEQEPMEGEADGLLNG